MRRFIPLLAAALMAVMVGSAVAKDAKPVHTAYQSYCPVAYVAMGKAMKGNPKFASVVNGQRILFANADAKKMFDADPAKYHVAYDGWCATAVSMGKRMKSDPGLFTVHAGKVYLFSSADAKQAFDAMPDSVIQGADAKWPSLPRR